MKSIRLFAVFTILTISLPACFGTETGNPPLDRSEQVIDPAIGGEISAGRATLTIAPGTLDGTEDVNVELVQLADGSPPDYEAYSSLYQVKTSREFAPGQTAQLSIALEESAPQTLSFYQSQDADTYEAGSGVLFNNTMTGVITGAGYFFAGFFNGGGFGGVVTPFPDTGVQAPVTFNDVSAGFNKTCGVDREDDSLDCWGAPFSTALPTDKMLRIDIYEDHGCGIRTSSNNLVDNTVVCWGTDGTGRTIPPSGTFSQVSAGSLHTCAINLTQEIACWGNNTWQQTDAPAGDYLQIDAGALHTCALKDDNTAACWGDNVDGESDAPDGLFVRVAAGNFSSCGIQESGSLTCWGTDSLPAPPAGTFSEISLGYDHGCAIDDSGQVRCWGSNNDYGQLDAPQGEFVAIDAGRFFSCARKAGGAIECWGDNSNDQLSP